MRIPLIFLYLIFLFSCSSKKDDSKKEQIIPSPLPPVPKIEVRLAGYLGFVRSFSFIQSSTLSEKEINKLYDEKEKSNPVYEAGIHADSTLKKSFEKLGMVKEEELLLSKFKFASKNKFFLTGNSGAKINILIDSKPDSGYSMTAFAGLDSFKIKIDYLMEVKYVLIDIIPGGFEEIVVLYEHYLANTEFYDLLVYEIKDNR
jgi:hypothetical protein